MIKTLAQLKRDLKVGTQLKVVYHDVRPEQIGNIKTISKTQSNGIYTTCPELFNGRASWLELPPASLVEYSDNKFTIFDVGSRELNEQEKEFLNRKKEEQQARPYDNPYYISLSIAKQMGIDYMATSTPNKRYNSYENKVYDSSIKGKKLFTFEIMA